MTDTVEATRNRRKVIAAGITGNVLEWYDFAVYGFYAPIIGKLFFPSDDPTVSLIASFGAFAAGFLMRPVGGFVFGHIGDKIGRKRALVLSVMLMAIPTGIIGILPDHATIGIAAAVLMVAMRMLQGLSVGGEYTGSIVYLAEHAPNDRRGFLTSWTLFGAVGGILLGSGVSALIANILSDAEVASWGWRIAFLSGILVGVVGLVVRRHLPDMPEDESEDKPANPVMEAFRTQWREMAKVIGFNIINAVGFYMMFVYVVTWLIKQVQEPRSEALDINTISMAVLLVLVPVFGALSDKVGRKPLLLFGAGGIALLGYPLIWLMHHPDFMMILLGQLGFSVLVGAYFGAGPATLTEMFPRRVRVSALSVGYNVGLAIFGGTTPLIATWLISRTHDDLSIAWYLIACAVVSFLVVLTLREGSRKPLPE
ncbi:MAG: MFS transporter [Alphaproteobacteria bacterium]|nr:MFS transporter [Alphaproteobacteria bacterium]